MNPSPTSIHLSLETGEVEITVLTPRLVHVRQAAGELMPRRSWAIPRADADFPAVPVERSESDAGITLKTDLVAVTVRRADGAVSFTNSAGRVFCADAQAPRVSGRGVHAARQAAPGERFYGFGERAGLLEKSGRLLTNWTTDPVRSHGPGVDPLYIAIPVYLSLQPGLCHAVYFNNTFHSEFDLRRLANRTAAEPAIMEWRADGGELDYYVVYGPTPAEALHGLTELLYRMPMPPRWALGYHQSRWSYQSADEVRQVADEFRSRQIPCDVIHLDIDHMDGYRNLTWNPQTYPDPAGLVAEMRSIGIRLVPIVDAGIKVDPAYRVYASGLQQDAFIRKADGSLAQYYVWPDDSVFADYLRPEVRDWWGSLFEEHARIGIEGIWTDMNEPVVFDKPFSQGGGGTGTLPLDAGQGPAGERTTHAEAHNLFGLGMAQATYEGMRRALGGRRPFVLCRSGFAGIQRWTASWMGDNDSWWEHLAMSLPQLMNMGLSGAPFVGVDIGGFGNEATPELFARWMQIGSLMPFCRGHSSAGTQPHEPWAFGAEVEQISRTYLTLRYRLLPYLYTQFWKAHQCGTPIFRPLFFDFPQDAALANLDDQVMVGPLLMAAPILQPGVRARAVYLPAGEWFDWWTGRRLTGGGWTWTEAPLDSMPLYVRAGAILPLGPAMQHTGERPLDELMLEVYPGEGEFTLYEDDGLTDACERGDYCQTHYRLHRRAGNLELEVWAREGSYQPPVRNVTVRFHGRVRLGEFSYTDDGTARHLRLGN